MDNRFLCKDCKFSKFIMDSVEEPLCSVEYKCVVKDEGNYVIECSAYETNNVIKNFVNWIKRQ